MLVIPAIDVRAGRAVRLHQGDFARETAYDADPADAARRWRDQGAQRVHLVDLDGARDGAPAHLHVVRRVAAALGDVPLQVGGGLRSAADVAAVLDAGARWAILGTAAHEDPALLAALCRDHPGAIYVGVDAREGRVAVRGWLDQTDVAAADLARRCEDAGAAGVIHTDIARDGTGAGPNLEAAGAVADAVGIDVVLSGGVGAAEHLRAAARDGRFAGVVVGRALYDGRMTLAQAHAAARPGRAARC